jgi:hypothetical protein
MLGGGDGPAVGLLDGPGGGVGVVDEIVPNSQP